MKKLTEQRLDDISSVTFRPTEAQKSVLQNIDKLLSSGQTVTKQDAINIPTDDKVENELPIDNLEGAFDILVSVGLIQYEPAGTIVLSSAGQDIVDNMSTADDIEAEIPEGPLPPAPGTTNIGFESFQLLSTLNNLSKFLKS